jgi:aspartyl protease family protein
MRWRRVRIAALSLLYLSSSGLLNIIGSEAEAVDRIYAATEIKSGGGGHYFATAQINGSSIKIVIDTGATAVAMPYEDAERAGLKPRLLNFTMPVSTANGMAKAAETTLDRVEINGVRVDNVRALVLPKGALNITLVGMSFLSKLRGFSVEDGKLVIKN